MPSSESLKPNWRHVGLFLGITFAATWLVDLGIDLHGGLGGPGAITRPGAIVAVQFQMLLPACTAILFGLFAFRESPIHVTTRTGAGRSFYYVFLGLTLLYALATFATWLGPAAATTLPLAEIVPEGATYLALVVLIGLHVFAGRHAMERVQLSWGNARYWLGLGLVIVGFYALQGVLNALTGLGPHRLSLPTLPLGLDPRVFALLAGSRVLWWRPFLQSSWPSVRSVAGGATFKVSSSSSAGVAAFYCLVSSGAPGTGRSS